MVVCATDIQAFADAIVREFRPQRIILFGSYAYGRPTADSDVDLLVVMPCRDSLDQALEIRQRLDAPFPMGLIVRTPSELKRRIQQHDWFLMDIVEKGKTLYEAADGRVGRKGGGRLQQRRTRAARPKGAKL